MITSQKTLELNRLYHRPTYTFSPSSYHPQRAANFYIGGFLTYHNHFLVSALRGLARLGRLFCGVRVGKGEGWRNKQANLTPSGRPSRRSLPPLYFVVPLPNASRCHMRMHFLKGSCRMKTDDWIPSSCSVSKYLSFPRNAGYTIHPCPSGVCWSFYHPHRLVQKEVETRRVV
jgi:hypothetical protein